MAPCNFIIASGPVLWQVPGTALISPPLPIIARAPTIGVRYDIITFNFPPPGRGNYPIHKYACMESRRSWLRTLK